MCRLFLFNIAILPRDMSVCVFVCERVRERERVREGERERERDDNFFLVKEHFSYVGMKYLFAL